MKQKLIKSIACIGLLGLASCTAKSLDTTAVLLANPGDVIDNPFEGIDHDYYSKFLDNLDVFSSTFASNLKDYDNTKNPTVSPLSVYMALAMSAECATGSTREEIANALNVSYSDVSKYTKVLYSISNNETKTSKEYVTNSIWIDNDITTKQSGINKLAEDYYCNPYSADFGNSKTNKEIRKFVSDKTNGLIDRDFDLSSDTLLTIINTLYIKDIWNEYGDDLNLTDKSYSFKNSDSTTTNTKLMMGHYIKGQVYETKDYKAFYTETNSGYRLKLIVPTGNSISSVFSSENIKKINSITDFKGETEDTRYYTRCLFPSFEASYSESVKNELSAMGIKKLFTEQCDFSNVTDTNVYCNDIKHYTKLKVDRKGIEGAAVTMEIMCGSAGPDGKKEVYSDFVVDKAFGFILTDRYGVEIFTGIVNKV